MGSGPDRPGLKRQSTIGVHFGRKGSGKSYLAKRKTNRSRRRTYVWDPQGEWAGPQADNGLTRSHVVTDSVSDWMRCVAAGSKPSRCTVFQACPSHEFTTLVAFVMERGDCVLVVDELHNVAPPQLGFTKVQGKRRAHPFVELIRTSRHRRVDLLLIAQRPAGVSRDVTSNADEIVCFRLTEKRDFEFVSARCGDSFVEGLASLGEYESKVWRADAQ